MKKHSLFLLFILCFMTISCSQEQKVRTINGIKIIETISNGKVTEQKIYHKNGNLHSIGEFKNKQPHGKWIKYFEDGTINQIEHFNRGSKSGEFKLFYKNGKQRTTGNYKKNRQVGEWKRFFENGSIKDISLNKGNGIVEYKSFYQNGKLERIGKFKSGIQIEEWKFYNENGELTESKNFESKK